MPAKGKGVAPSPASLRGRRDLFVVMQQAPPDQTATASGRQDPYADAWIGNRCVCRREWVWVWVYGGESGKEHTHHMDSVAQTFITWAHAPGSMGRAHTPLAAELCHLPVTAASLSPCCSAPSYTHTHVVIIPHTPEEVLAVTAGVTTQYRYMPVGTGKKHIRTASAARNPLVTARDTSGGGGAEPDVRPTGRKHVEEPGSGPTRLGMAQVGGGRGGGGWWIFGEGWWLHLVRHPTLYCLFTTLVAGACCTISCCCVMFGVCLNLHPALAGSPDISPTPMPPPSHCCPPLPPPPHCPAIPHPLTPAHPPAGFCPLFPTSPPPSPTPQTLRQEEPLPPQVVVPPLAPPGKKALPERPPGAHPTAGSVYAAMTFKELDAEEATR